MPWLRVRIAALLALLALASAAAIQPDDKHQLKAEIRNELLEELQTLLQRSTRSVSAADASSSPDSAAGHSRARRFLNDVVTINQLTPTANYIPPNRDGNSRTAVTTANNPDYIPTTAAENFIFFTLTTTNTVQKSNIFGVPYTLNKCLAAVSSQRCTDASCTALTNNDVPQKIYSWDSESQRWWERGPGATGPSSGTGFPANFKPILGNGVRGLTHFSPDQVHDFVVPASFTGDVVTTGVSKPTEQCGDVWRYVDSTNGWVRYQSCIWSGHGTRSVAQFTMAGEQYLVHTSMVDRRYLNGDLIAEVYSLLPNFVLKWSSRVTDNFGNAMPYGFFLSGGETGVNLGPGDPGYNPAVGNNGNNVFQTFLDLTGVVHAEPFEILGMYFLAFAQYVSDANCPAAPPTGTVPQCLDFEIESRVYMFNGNKANTRGDCLPNGTPAGCQNFQGEFELLQALPTKGARHIHFFTIQSTGQHAAFLAVAESHDNTLATTESSLWKWNGREFGLFQRLPTTYAASFSSFEVDGRTFLVVANRGCPDLERVDLATSCTLVNSPANTSDVARARIFHYVPANDNFELVPDGLDDGTLHALGINEDDTTDPDEPVMLGETLAPSGVAVATLDYVDLDAFFVDPVSATKQRTYLAVANARPLETTTDSDGKHLANFFEVASSTASGVTNTLINVREAATDNAAFLTSLNTQLTGGDGLHLNIRQQNADFRFYGASAASAFTIDGQRYVVMGFDQTYQTTEQCVARYANASSPDAVCTHLPSAQQAVATEAACALSCNAGNQPTQLPFAHRQTETIIYRMDESTEEGGVPVFNETQRIPSLGVAAIHLFQLTEPTTQEAYEACASRSSPDCYLNQPVRQSHIFLAIANAYSSCEQTSSGTYLPPDPERVVRIYRWNSDAAEFELWASLDAVTCSVRAIQFFSTACHEVDGVSVSPPACNHYLALAEDCNHHVDYHQQESLPAFAARYRVSFHKFTAANHTFLHCQPYEDPGDPRNQQESPCFQPADPFRAAGLVLPSDEHFFDFPDLLPASLDVGTDLIDDGSGYYTQLVGSNIAGLSLGQPLAQKDVYFLPAAGFASFELVPDNDGVNRTIYYLNGRARHEQLLIVSYDAATPPQVFALRSVAKRTIACAARHATTPRRRAFWLAQTLSESSGGKVSKFFTRQSLVGVDKVYAIVAERQLRPSQVDTNRLSSVYVNFVCDEYGPYTFAQADGFPQPTIPYGGITAPRAVGLPAGDTEWCFHSVSLAHYEAWEAFENYYNPVAGCRGRTQNRAGTSFQYVQRYYNREPPALLVGFRGVHPPTGRYIWSRAASDTVILSTRGYDHGDYDQLFSGRDNPLVKLQDLPTAGPLDVTATEVCGPGSQLWLVFSSQAFANSITPPIVNYIFVWRDRYAVAYDPNTEGYTQCTAAAARQMLQTTAAEVANLGCFEAIQLAVPANSPESAAALIFSVGDFLLLSRVNRRAAVVDNINPPISLDPTACVANRPDDEAGVASVVYGVSLTTFGGLQCRATELDAATLRRLADAGLDLAQLEQHFVTLDTAQVITGDKFFNASVGIRVLDVTEDANVAGDVVAEGDVVAYGNVAVLGLVDGVDLSVFASAQQTRNAEVAARLASIEARLCKLNSQVEMLHTGVFGAGTGDATQECVALARTTGCYPKASLSLPAQARLKVLFASAVKDDLGTLAAVTNISNIEFFPGSATFYFALQAPLGSDLQTAAAAMDVSTFFYSPYCSNTALPEAPPGMDFLPHTLNFVFLDCTLVPAQAVQLIRTVTAEFLRAYGVRPTDVVVLQTSCGMYVVHFYVAVAEVFSTAVLTELNSKAFWTLVYEELVLREPTIFAEIDEALEYLPGQYVPDPDDSGSGSGSGAPTP